jgi:hypothetical protein
MAVKEAIELVGGDQVQQQIAKLTAELQKMADQLNSAGTQGLGSGAAQATTNIENMIVKIGGASLALSAHTEQVKGATEAYHVLHPLLQSVGLQFGEMRAFAALANTSLLGLAGVGIAAVLVELTKIGDEAKQTEQNLSDLFGSVAAGAKAFEDTEKAAAKLGTSADALAKPLETLTRTYTELIATQSKGKFVSLDPDGKILVGLGDLTRAEQNFTKANEAMFEILRAGGDTTAKALQQSDAFFASFAKGGKLTADILRTLPVGTIEELAAAMGKGQVNAAQYIAEIAKLGGPTMQQVIEALVRYKTQADKSFETKAVISFQDEMRGLQTVLLQGFKDLAGVDFSSFTHRQLGLFRDDIQAIIDLAKKAKAGLQAALSPDIPTPSAEEQTQQITGAPAAPLQGTALSKSLKDLSDLTAGFQKLGQAGKDSATTTLQAWSTVGTQIKSSVDDPLQQSGSLAQTMADKIIAALKAIGTQSDDTKKKVDAVKETFAGGTSVAFGKGAFVTQPGAGTAGVPGGVVSAAAQEAQAAIRQLGLPDSGAIDNLKESFNQLVTTLGVVATNFGTVRDAIQGAIDAAGDLAQDLNEASQVNFANMVSQMNQVASAAERAASAAAQIRVPSGGGGGIPLATGGLFRGRGGIDTNLAWLTDYEYVMNPSAVRKYGVGFMDMINSMTLPFDRMLRDLRGYAIGGLVTPATVTSAPTPVHIHFAGQSFETNASEDVARALRKHAIRSRMVTTGRKPSWY